MSTLKIYIGATLQFVRTLLTRKDPIRGKCSQGHLLLEGWTECPKCRIIQRQVKISKGIKAKSPKLELLCFEGEHEGEVFLIREGATVLGPQASASLCLTPASSGSSKSACVIAGAANRMTIEKGEVFKLADRETNKGTILDYDELKISGNSFLFLDLDQVEKGSSNERVS